MENGERKRMSLKKRWALTALVSVLAFFFSYVMAMYPQLPPRVASHFNAQGVADGWMTKDQYTLFNIAIQVFVGGILVAIALLIHLIPDLFINIPRKKYWLAPERRKSTLESVSVSIIWIAVCTSTFLFATVHLTDRVNLGAAAQLGTEIWVALAIYLSIITLICVWYFVRFMSIDRTTVDKADEKS